MIFGAHVLEDCRGCALVGTEFEWTDRVQRRVALSLLRQASDTDPFKAAFSDVAAYHIDRSALGQVIVDVRTVELADLIAANWDGVKLGSMAGTWPDRAQASPAEAAEIVTRRGLHAFVIDVSSARPCWVIGRSFERLGWRSRA